MVMTVSLYNFLTNCQLFRLIINIMLNRIFQPLPYPTHIQLISVFISAFMCPGLDPLFRSGNRKSFFLLLTFAVLCCLLGRMGFCETVSVCGRTGVKCGFNPTLLPMYVYVRGKKHILLIVKQQAFFYKKHRYFTKNGIYN